jgi:hypothetical protein
MKNGVFWDDTPCGACYNRRFGATSRLHHRSVRRLLLTANVVPSSPILVLVMMEALRSSATPVVIRATRRNNRADSILCSHRMNTSNLT